MSDWNHCFGIWHSDGITLMGWAEGGAEASCAGLSRASLLLQHARCRVGGALFQQGMDQGCYPALYTLTLEDWQIPSYFFGLITLCIQSEHFCTAICHSTISALRVVTREPLSLRSFRDQLYLPKNTSRLQAKKLSRSGRMRARSTYLPNNHLQRTTTSTRAAMAKWCAACVRLTA